MMAEQALAHSPQEFAHTHYQQMWAVYSKERGETASHH